jgi:hypothetical protein
MLNYLVERCVSDGAKANDNKKMWSHMHTLYLKQVMPNQY